MALKKTRIEVNNAVSSLPHHVAKEGGCFAGEGCEVELVPAGSRRDRAKEIADCDGIVGAKLAAGIR